MHKPFSKQQREHLIGFIGGAIIRMSRGSEREFERLLLKEEALHLDVAPNLDLLAHALAAGWNGGYDSEFVERTLTGLYGVDSRDLADAQAYTKERFPDGEFL
jgi:hypothetical protein